MQAENADSIPIWPATFACSAGLPGADWPFNINKFIMLYINILCATDVTLGCSLIKVLSQESDVNLFILCSYSAITNIQ